MKKFLYLGAALLAPCAAFGAKSEKPEPYYLAVRETAVFLTADAGTLMTLSPRPFLARGEYKLQLEGFIRMIPRLPLYVGTSLDFYPHRQPSLYIMGWQTHVGMGGYVFDLRTPKGTGWTMMMSGAFTVGFSGAFDFFMGARLTTRFSYFFNQSAGVTFGPSLGYQNNLGGANARHRFSVGAALGFSFSRKGRAR